MSKLSANKARILVLRLNFGQILLILPNTRKNYSPQYSLLEYRFQGR